MAFKLITNDGVPTPLAIVVLIVGISPAMPAFLAVKTAGVITSPVVSAEGLLKGGVAIATGVYAGV